MSPRRLAPVFALACLLLAAANPTPASAQDMGLNPKRRVEFFDFEEAKFGNYENLPAKWFAIGRPADNVDENFLRQPLNLELTTMPGFPRFSPVRFSKPQNQPGNHSLFLGLDGGNVGAFLQVGAITAIPQSEYLIEAKVKTANLKRSAAYLVGYLIDDQKRRIDASVAISEPIRTQGQWDTVSVKIQGEYKNAAYIGIQVEILQPMPDANSPLGNEQIVLEDVHGQAWFDDIAVWQMPHASVQTASPVNVLRDPQKPEINVEVRDLTGHALSAQVTIYNERRQPVASTIRNVGDGAPEAWRWTPDLPSYGWYLVDLKVFDTLGNGRSLTTAIARSLSAFLWLPNEPPMDYADSLRFGLIADQTPDDRLALLPELLNQTGIHAVTLSMWTPTTNLINLDERLVKLDDLVQPLLMSGRQVTLSLSPLPRELAHALEVDATSPLSIFGKPIAGWRPYLAPFLLRHGQGVRLWQMGESNVSVDSLGADLGPLLSAADRGLQTLAPLPRIVIPWRLDLQRPRGLATPVIYQMRTPWMIPAERIGDYLKAWRANPAADCFLNLEEPPASEITHARRIQDMALRMIYAWEGSATGLTLTRPWADGNTRKVSLLPDPILGVFSSVANRLAGRRVVGHMPLGRGLECVIFDGKTAGGMLAAWNRSAEPADANIDLYLGAGPVAVDVWGNRTAIPLVNGKHHVALSNTPIFIEGIDPELALFRSAFTLTPPFIESTQTPHNRTITLANPWHRTISGNLTIVSPEDSRIDPRQIPFSIAGGETTAVPIQLIFPISEVAGNKKLVVRFDFMSDKHYRFEASTPMELGLKDIQFDASLSFTTNPATGKHDAIVTQFVTNMGDTPLSLYAFAQITGFPRQEGIISQLRPRQSIIRRFHFADAQDALATEPVRVGLRETRGPAVLNKVLWASDAKN